MSSLAELAEALRALHAAAAERRDCTTLLAQLDALRRDLEPQLDPRLNHFLERRSYEKALAFLEQGSPST